MKLWYLLLTSVWLASGEASSSLLTSFGPRDAGHSVVAYAHSDWHLWTCVLLIAANDPNFTLGSSWSDEVSSSSVLWSVGLPWTSSTSSESVDCSVVV